MLGTRKRWEPSIHDLHEALAHGYYTGSGYDSAALQRLDEQFMVHDLTEMTKSRVTENWD